MHKVYQGQLYTKLVRISSGLEIHTLCLTFFKSFLKFHFASKYFYCSGVIDVAVAVVAVVQVFNGILSRAQVRMTWHYFDPLTICKTI